MQERTPTLRTEQPDKPMRELMSVLAEEWKHMSEADMAVRAFCFASDRIGGGCFGWCGLVWWTD